MSFIVISSSLNPDSNSRILAHAAYVKLKEKHEVELVDLREYELPLCDGDAAYSHPHVSALAKKIAQASCILLAVPIYNYSFGSAAKNLIELTGHSWEDKTVGFLCAAGGKFSYMSVMGLANSLMLDFRCLIIPRFVYATGDSFSDRTISDATIEKRIDEFVAAAIQLNGAAVTASAVLSR